MSVADDPNPPAPTSPGATVSMIPPTSPVAPVARPDFHAHSATPGLHHVHAGHWARNLVDTVVGALRSVIR